MSDEDQDSEVVKSITIYWVDRQETITIYDPVKWYEAEYSRLGFFVVERESGKDHFKEDLIRRIEFNK